MSIRRRDTNDVKSINFNYGYFAIFTSLHGNDINFSVVLFSVACCGCRHSGMCLAGIQRLIPLDSDLRRSDVMKLTPRPLTVGYLVFI